LQRAHRVAATAIDWIWGIRLPLHVELGRRVRVWHHGCVLLNARAIGDDVHLRHNTTFGPLRGTGPDDDPSQLPIIEKGADIGSGACVLGPVRVGEGAIVGANTVVLKNVPDGATILGVPGRVIPS
jgi:serine O-acetyltransferase